MNSCHHILNLHFIKGSPVELHLIKQLVKILWLMKR